MAQALPFAAAAAVIGEKMDRVAIGQGRAEIGQLAHVGRRVVAAGDQGHADGQVARRAGKLFAGFQGRGGWKRRSAAGGVESSISFRS